jgi:DNA-binding beta-propeller fold protein YncE
VLGLLGGRTATAASAPGRAHYNVKNTVLLGSPEDWDYVYFDEGGKGAYVAHGTEVTVVDGQTGAIRGRVRGLDGVHGLAASSALGKGYAVSRQQHALAVFDLKSFAVTRSIPIGAGGDSLVLEPVNHRVLVMDAQAPVATVIDTTRDSVVATLPLGGIAEQAAASSTGKVFVNLAELRAVARLDARVPKIEALWQVPSCESPHGIAIDDASQRVFVSCVNKLLLVLDAVGGRLIASLPIGSGTDGVAFDPKRKRVFSSNGWDGTLSLIEERSPDDYISLGDEPTVHLGRTMAIDRNSGRLYIAAADLDRIDPARGKWAQYVMKPGTMRLLLLDPAD